MKRMPITKPSQKLVKRQNHENPRQSSTFTWRISFPPPAIMNRAKEKNPGQSTGVSTFNLLLFCLEYFSYKVSVMNTLQGSTRDKIMGIKDLSPSMGGGGIPTKASCTNASQLNERTKLIKWRQRPETNQTTLHSTIRSPPRQQGIH